MKTNFAKTHINIANTAVKLLLIACLILISVFWATLVESEGSEKDAKTSAPPVIKLGLNVACFNTLDPHQAASSSDRILADMVFNGLIRYKPGLAPDLEPDLALNIPEPEIINGEQVWTFHLRKGVLFHSAGNTSPKEMTAQTILLSFEKAMDPKRSAYAGGYDGINLKALGPYTVCFTVNPPQSPLLFLPKVANYAGGFIVSKTDKGRLLGTGPFIIKDQTDKNKFFLAAHTDYFRGTPCLGGVKIYFLPDSYLRLSEFHRHLDVICGESVADWINHAMTMGGKNTIIDSLGVPETANIHFNTLIQPFADIRVRKAVAHALSRDVFLESFGPGMAQNVFSPAPPFMPGGLTESEVRALGLHYPKDLKKSRQLLTEAGYPDGFQFEVVVSEMDQYKKNYMSLKKQLAAVNIHMVTRITDHATMHQLIRKDLNPIVIYEAFRPNTDELLSRFFHSESIVMTGDKPVTNFSHYTGIDDLIEKARAERIITRQVKLWEYAQIKLLEDMVVYPLHFRKHTYVRKKYVDYGHAVKAAMALYPQITENTCLLNRAN